MFESWMVRSDSPAAFQVLENCCKLRGLAEHPGEGEQRSLQSKMGGDFGFGQEDHYQVEVGGARQQ